MNKRSITGKGIRRRLKGFFTRQMNDENANQVQLDAPVSDGAIKAPKPLNQLDQSHTDKTQIKEETPQSLTELPPKASTQSNVDASITSTQLKSTLELSKPSSPFIQKAMPSTVSQAANKPLTFAERIAQGKTPIQDQTATDGPSFTSGPAAHIRAEQLAAEATVQSNDDGIEYWGPVDNDSARAKAAGQILVIDQEECISCGTCVENTEHVFYLPDEAKAVTIEQEGPMELIQDAIDACPVTCIHWTDTPLDYRQLNDRHGKPI